MAALLALLLLPKGTSSLVLSAVILLFGLSGLSWGGLYLTLAAERAGQAAAGVGLGIASTWFQVGSTVTPLLFGYLADVTGAYTASWGCWCWGCCSASAWWAACRPPRSGGTRPQGSIPSPNQVYGPDQCACGLPASAHHQALIAFASVPQAALPLRLQAPSGWRGPAASSRKSGVELVFP
jgi:hypothetical protein